MKRFFILLAVIGAAALIGGVGLYFYHLGKSQVKNELTNLQEEIARLKADEEDAAIVKRVSKQMEEIAYQQKAISDKQRDRAEEQSELALQMRDKAEKESHLARQAEQKATKAAEEAEKERANALSHQKMAEAQRDEATLAKSITDTLSCRNLGKTMGNAAITQYEIKQKEMADMLSYLSWYLLDHYKGNVYQPETFKSLSMCTEENRESSLRYRGAVNGVAPTSEQGCVAVTDYGEIEYFKEIGKKSENLFHNQGYNFTDVWLEDNMIYALSLHGPLCVVGFDKSLKTIDIPEGKYFKILKFNTNTFLLAAKDFLYLYSKNLERGTKIDLKGELVAIVKRKNLINLFFADCSYATMDGTGKVTHHEPICPRRVTTAYYHPQTGGLYLGMENGDICMINKNDRLITYLNGHNSRVSSITQSGNILISSGYDKSVLLWNMPKIQFPSGLSYMDELESKKGNQTVRGKRTSRIAEEWLNPVPMNYENWPLIVVNLNENSVVVGTSGGKLFKETISVPYMAKKIGKSIRNFTQEEWDKYVGNGVPYINLKND